MILTLMRFTFLDEKYAMPYSFFHKLNFNREIFFNNALLIDNK